MGNVVKPTPWWTDQPPTKTTPPEPPDPPDMQARVTKLEASAQDTRDRLVRIEARLDSHEKLFASKEDLARAEGSLKAAIAEAKSSIIMWVVSAFILAQLLPMLLKKLGL